MNHPIVVAFWIVVTFLIVVPAIIKVVAGCIAIGRLIFLRLTGQKVYPNSVILDKYFLELN
jgi:hypothetical protein